MIKFLISFFLMIISILSSSGQNLEKADLIEGSNPEFFEFQIDGYYIAINSAGNMRGWQYNLNLNYESGFHTKSIQYIKSGDSLLICAEITNDDVTNTKLSRFDKNKFNKIWSISLDNSNVSVGKLENELLYIGANNSVYKIDFHTGNIIWKSENIYDKYKINKLISIKLLSKTVELIGVKQIREQHDERLVVILDKNSGKILQIK